MRAKQIMDNDGAYIAHTYSRFPVVADRARGARVNGADGREYIDLGSGIGVNSLGYADDGWIRAVTKQLGRLAHISNLYYSEPCASLAKALCGRTGMDKVFFANSGAEANEAAIKCARKYSHDKYGAGRSVIVSLQNSFHGRTMAALSATGQDAFHQHFDPFLEGFRFAPANDFEASRQELRDDVCAVIMELIQGEGGVMPLEQEYVDSVAAYCQEHDLLLIIDEVQTGAGRTGKFLCCEHYGLRPDLITMAKGLGGGLPIGALLMGTRCSAALGPGDHASTFGGNPAVCAGALEVVERLDQAMLDSVMEKGAFLREKLGQSKNVTGVDGLGMMLGLRLRDGIAARDVVEKALSRGVIALTAKSKIRLLPPLIIPWQDCEEAAGILSECIDEF